MKAVWLDQSGPALRAQHAELRPGEDQDLELDVLLAGICGTDLQLARGYAAFQGVPGHEFVGRLARDQDIERLLAAERGRGGEPDSNPDASRFRLASPPPSLWKRRRVVAEINVPCRACPRASPSCARHCPERTVVGIRGRPGAFAQRIRLPACNLHPVSDDLPDESAVFCEPLAASLQVLKAAKVLPEDEVLVVGAGRLGQLVARVLAPLGCRLLVSARYPSQVRRLREQGIETVSPQDVPRERFTVVVEATGSSSGLRAALSAVRPGGRIVLKSTYAPSRSEASGNGGDGGSALSSGHPADPVVDLSQVVVDEIQLLGSRCGPFPPALRLLESGRIDPRDLIDDVLDLKDVREAFARAAQPGALKVLLRCPQPADDRP